MVHLGLWVDLADLWVDHLEDPWAQEDLSAGHHLGEAFWAHLLELDYWEDL